MSAPRVLLVESLDAVGSDAADARGRRSALRSAGAVVRVATLAPARGGGPAAATTAGAGAVAEFDTGPDGLESLRRFAREGHFDLILLAAATPGGGRAAEALEGVAPARWWPTGVAQASDWRARWRFGSRATLAPMGEAEPSRSIDEAPAGLAWSSVESPSPGRPRLTLWDGDYLLGILPLVGAEGSRVLAAFALLAAEWSGLDLVVLADPQPAFEREARVLGVATRVHFVGPAPREAECAWWAHASGAILAGRVTFAGGLLLRALAAGCPLIVASPDGTWRSVSSWLTHHGCTPWSNGGGGEGLAGALARVLGRGPTIEGAVTRGRALAAAHAWSLLPRRLAGALPRLVFGPTGRRPASAA